MHGRILRAAALVAALCVAGAPLWADTVSVPLKPMEIPDSTNAMARLAVRSVPGQMGGNPAVRVPPKGISRQATYFRVQVAGTTLVMVMEYSRSASKLYIDGNSDGDLSDERPLVARMSRGRKQVFPAFPLKGPGDAKVFVKIEAESQYTLSLYPGAMFSGAAKVGDKSFHVFVADGNLNGTYDDAYASTVTRTAVAAHDVLGVDMDGNRRLGGTAAGCEEAMPLPKAVRLGDAFYSVKVASDGSSLDLEKVEMETGTLDVAAPCADLLLWSENGAYRICGGATKCELPVGHYTPIDLNLVAKDRSGATWTLNGRPSGNVTAFDIAAGEIKTLPLGPPLTAKVSIGRGTGGTLSLGFSVRGTADESYDAMALRNGTRQPLPRFKIVSESGKVVGSGSWSYG